MPAPRAGPAPAANLRRLGRGRRTARSWRRDVYGPVAQTRGRVPLEKIATLLQDRFGLTVTPGGLAQVLHRAARVAAPTYAALCAQIRGSPVVSPDETGWRVGAVLHWLWAFATPETTVYAIRPGRSFDDAVTILGADFAGVLVRDGWAPYRRFTGALHQSCLAHLFRRCRTLRADHPRSPWAARGQAVLTDALALRDRRDAHAITEQSLAGPAGACLPAWAGSSTRRPLCRRPNASPGISTASSRLCSPSCGPPTSTRPTGALNTPSAPPSSIARSVAGIGRPAAHGPNRSSRVWSAPRVNAMSTSTTSSPRCCGRRGRWSPRLFASRRCRITRETKTLL